jgi:hypothetical protein
VKGVNGLFSPKEELENIGYPFKTRHIINFIRIIP